MLDCVVRRMDNPLPRRPWKTSTLREAAQGDRRDNPKYDQKNDSALPLTPGSASSFIPVTVGVRF
jgi:hypothetical protein